MKYVIKRAARGESKVLTDVAMSSKAFWGYSDAFMLAAKAELQVTESRLIDRNFDYQCLLLDNQIVGFYALSLMPQLTDFSHCQFEQSYSFTATMGQQQDKIVELEGLFVAPAFIGKGFGQILFAHACAYLRSRNKTLIIIQSDPNALPFYLKQGCKKVGSKESGSVRHRHLPLLSFTLE